MADLMDYNTADLIRTATPAEVVASVSAARQDGGAGVIRVDGRACFVLNEDEDLESPESKALLVEICAEIC
jgi:hypothetical protein